MISVEEAAKLLKISGRRIRILCEQERIVGAQKVGSVWILPEKPQVIAAARRRPSKVKMKEAKL